MSFRQRSEPDQVVKDLVVEPSHTSPMAGPGHSPSQPGDPMATAADPDPAMMADPPGEPTTRTTPDASPHPVPEPVSESSPGKLRRFGPAANLSPVPPQLAKQLSTSRHVPDTALDWLDTDTGQVRALSTRGHMHRHLAEVRQDSFGIGTPDGYLTLSVADGVGAASASQVGSAYAARTSVAQIALVEALIKPGTTAVSLGLLSSTLHTFAAERGLEPRQLSTTLVFAAVADRPPSADGFDVTLAQIGDSSAWRLRDGQWTLLGAGPEDDAESPIDTSVECLPLYSTARVWRETFRPGETLALVSDGVGNILPANQEFADALAELWRADAPAPAALLSVLDATVRTFDDDRTFVGFRFAGRPE